MIETVLGPIEPERLGPVSMHEHLLSDARGLGIADVVLDDEGLAAAELGRLRDAWRTDCRASFPDSVAIKSGNEALVPAVVDPPVWGFGGPTAGLAEISRRSGVAIVAGVGAYVPRTRPGWLTAMDEDALVGMFCEALLDHLPGCDFRAGIVGMLAPGLPLDATCCPSSPTGLQKTTGWEVGGGAARSAAAGRG
jgi:phosphotriesterase-related protein